MIKQDQQSGFTLFELLIYVTLVSLLSLVFFNFAIDISTTAQKTVVKQEAQQHARFALQRIVQEIRRAEGVNTGSSTFDTHPGVLSLQMADAGENPTIFDVSSGVLRIKQGASAAEDLTPTNFTVSNLVFEDLTVTGRTSNIKITLTLSHPNPENSEIFDVESTVLSAATIRVLED